MLSLVVASALAMAGCHSMVRIDETTRGATSLRPRKGPNRLGALTVGVANDGSFRAEQPTWCPHDIMVKRRHYIIDRKRPNVATFIVGLIAVSLGGVAAAVGASDDRPSSSPFTWAGVAAIGVGLPLAIGPFIGNTSTRRGTGEDTARQGSKWVRCGTTPAAASHAVLQWGDTRIPSPVSSEGRFSVSAFDLVDAFQLSRTPALSLSATMTTASGPRKASVFIGTKALTRARAGFFRRMKIDGDVQPLRKVPRLETRSLLITRSTVAGEPSIIVELAVENTGPGAAWGVRGAIAAALPEVDARVIYLGRVPAHSTGRGRVVIPMTDARANLLDARIAVVLHDAHKTTNATPYRFRGPVLNARPEQ